MRAIAGLSLMLLAGAAAPQGADLRDTLELASGEVRRGRALQRHEPDRLLWTEGGRRDEIAWAQVGRLRTVADLVGEFLDLRREGLGIEAEWTLAEVAAARGLAGLARLQAMHVLLRAPEHEGAHAMLGHPGRKGQWRWRWEGELSTAAEVDRRTTGHVFELRAEHFVLRSASGLRTAIDTLFDLERAYTSFWRELGADLRPISLFEPVEVHLHASAHELPKLNSDLPEPYCDPSLRGGGAVHLYAGAPGERPVGLPAVVVEQLLYTTLLAPKAGRPPTIHDRIAPWLEVGLGRWFGSRAEGRPGHLRLGVAKLDPLLAAKALRYRPYGLEQLVHLQLVDFHADPTAAAFHVANTSMFVAWLMDPDAKAGEPAVALRPRFLAYVRACFHDGKGNSSSLLDAALGREIGRVEHLEPAWVAWLAARSGIAATRQRYELPANRSLRRLLLGR